ncbi:MAG: hypothetical protein ACPIA8_07475, partial [Candidatus Puniceispirillaceae bacterium]
MTELSENQKQKKYSKLFLVTKIPKLIRRKLKRLLIGRMKFGNLKSVFIGKKIGGCILIIWKMISLANYI